MRSVAKIIASKLQPLSIKLRSELSGSLQRLHNLTCSDGFATGSLVGSEIDGCVSISLQASIGSPGLIKLSWRYFPLLIFESGRHSSHALTEGLGGWLDFSSSSVMLSVNSFDISYKKKHTKPSFGTLCHVGIRDWTLY